MSLPGKRDIAHEWNPLLVVLAGKGALLAVKAIGTAVCAFVMWDIYKHWPRLGLISSYGFLAVYSGIVLWNTWLYLGAYS